jgi:hypothetical protein
LALGITIQCCGNDCANWRDWATLIDVKLKN